MARRWATGLIISCAVVVSAAEAPGQQCLHAVGETTVERSRRETAVDFVAGVNAAQKRWHREMGEYGSLHELRQSSASPLGFVPRLVVDQFGYALRVTDTLDPCSFSLFSDELGIVFEAHPTLLERKVARSQSPLGEGAPGEKATTSLSGP